MNVIASDKTGTLTQNRMFVASAAVGVNSVDLDECRLARSLAFQQLVGIAGLCNNARFDDDDNNQDNSHEEEPAAKSKLHHRHLGMHVWHRRKTKAAVPIATSGDGILRIKQRKATGDATDIALLKFYTEHNRIAGLAANYDTLADIPFNSRNKWLMKIVRARDLATHEQMFGSGPATGYGFDSDVVLLKGAPDYLLKK